MGKVIASFWMLGPCISLLGSGLQGVNMTVKYQPSGVGGTRSLPAMPQRLQHLTGRLIQNGRQWLEKG